MHREHFNQLSPQQLERLAIIQAALSKCSHTVAKIIQHGYESHNPRGNPAHVNRLLLEREMGAVMFAFEYAIANRDVSSSAVITGAHIEQAKIVQCLHHGSKAPYTTTAHKVDVGEDSENFKKVAGEIWEPEGLEWEGLVSFVETVLEEVNMEEGDEAAQGEASPNNATRTLQVRTFPREEE